MKKSFTLIELLVVIAIIGLLVIIIAIPINRARQGASIARILQYEASLHRYLGSDIVGWWQFDEGEGSVAYDISGNDNHGTLVNNPQWVDGVPGKGGSALEFNGVDEYIEIGNDKNLSFTNNVFTFSFWMKANNKTSLIGVLGKRTSPWEYSIHVNTSGGNLLFMAWNNAGQAVYPSSSVSYTTDWTHFSWTADGKYSKVYKNGYLISTKEKNNENNMEKGNSPLRIGEGGQATGARYMDGSIDDLRIYSRALTSEEIQTIYTETKDKYLTEEL